MARMLRRDPLNAQDFRTQRHDLPEDLNQPLYDRVNVATTVPSSVSWFSVARGQTATLIVGNTGAATASTMKTYRDTNLDQAGVSPAKMYKFSGMSLAIIHATRQLINNAADRALIMDGGYINFRIIDKDILFLPNICVPVLNPVEAMATTVNNTTAFSVGSGGGLGKAMYGFPIPITLNPYETFNVSSYWTATVTLTTTVDLLLVLQAFMRRPT